MAPSQRELLPAYRGLPKGSYLGLTRLTNYSYVPILSFPPPMRSRADYGGNPGLEMLHLHSHSPPPRGQASRDCCRIAFLSLFVQNNPYFCVAKTTILPFGNSPLNARSQTRSLLSSTGKLQFPRPLSLTRHSSLPRKAGSSGESLK